MNATTTTGTPVDKAGAILSPAIWDALAGEYLAALENQLPTWAAACNARLLAEHVDREVLTVRPHWFRYRGVNWVESYDPEPYADLDAMEDAWLAARADQHREVLVSGEYCDSHPVFTHEQNVKFRVWHDTSHVAQLAGFDPDGELRVFVAQAQNLHRTTRSFAPPLVEALFCESVYQLAACLHLGGFPDRQTVRTYGPVGRAVCELLLAL